MAFFKSKLDNFDGRNEFESRSHVTTGSSDDCATEGNKMFEATVSKMMEFWKSCRT